MKKLLFGLLLLASCTPVQYVYVDPKDSTVKKQRVIYDNIYDTHIPLYFQYNPYLYGRPFYNPIIIQRQRPIVVPQRRSIIVPQRPQYRPLPPRQPRQPRNR
jgi:hypothetical protein